MIGLVRDHDVLVAGHRNLDMHDRWDRAVAVLIFLIDTHAAGRQAAVDFLQPRDVIADGILDGGRGVAVAEGDFEWNLHGRTVRVLVRLNAATGDLVSAQANLPWQCLNFLPEPHGHGSLRPTLPQLCGSFGFLAACDPCAPLPLP